MKKIFLVIISINLFLISCNTVRESAGVSRKVIDEYTVVEKPPLVIPPNFDLIPPDQIQSKNIENIDSELAKEILFGLDEIGDKTISDDSLIQQIVNETEEENMEDNIRENIDKEFSGEKSSKEDETIFQSEDELNSAIEETKSKNNNNDNSSTKEKKKKRFFFF